MFVIAMILQRKNYDTFSVRQGLREPVLCDFRGL